jgi:hypothetical protein
MTKSEREQWFADKVLRDYYEWRSKLPHGSRRGVRYRGMITKHGAVGAAKWLLNSDRNAKKRDSFGIEYWVTCPQFRPLFSVAEVKEAERRWAEAPSS